ncbi:hypothetical protein V9T40_003285 [Parthenolecanium corni]|uniref:Uncharacterized protein n=1 Tax=Parthenolecanium corni TaxID=536013 RepID=A0AAN9TUR8_9HEMI
MTSTHHFMAPTKFTRIPAPKPNDRLVVIVGTLRIAIKTHLGAAEGPSTKRVHIILELLLISRTLQEVKEEEDPNRNIDH